MKTDEGATVHQPRTMFAVRRPAITIAVVVLLMSLVPAAPGYADSKISEPSPDVERELSDLGMTADEFTRRARAMGTPPGLLRQALQDVDRLRFVPVHHRRTRGEQQVPVSRNGAFSALASCKTVSNSITYENVFQADLARYTLNKTWCYTGSSTTSGSSWPQGWVAAWAVPWDYQGEIGNSERMSGTWAHVSWSQGKFTVCAEVCGGRYPIIEIVGKGNGTSQTTTRP